MPSKITAVFHLAYDWRLAIEAVRRIAPYVDKVLLVFDSDRKTWTLREYTSPPFDQILTIFGEHGVDTNHITVCVAPFSAEMYVGQEMAALAAYPHIANLPPPLRRETLQRNWASLQVEPGHWVLQLDGDEWGEDPKMFCAWLRDQRSDEIVNARWFNVWKRVASGFLVVDPTTLPPGFHARVATARRGDLVVSREPARGTEVWSPFTLLHWSIGGRGGRAGLEAKLKGWGLMTSDAEADLFLDAWDATNETNYRQMDWITPSRKPGYGNQKLMLVTPEQIVQRFGPADYERYIDEWKAPKS